MTEALAKVIASPEWVPHRFVDGTTIEFVRLSQPLQRGLPFLDARYVEASLPRICVPVGELPMPEVTLAQDCHFIFHSAFCCSTLLGRALDREGVATVLQEPQILADFASIIAGSGDDQNRDRELASVLALLHRPHRPSETTIVKLSNSANGLIEPLLALRPRARAVIMYAPLPLFLLKVAIGGAIRRRWARSVARVLSRRQQAGSPTMPDLRLMTDLEAAAYLWLQHQQQFARLTVGPEPRRFAIVEAGDLLNDPVHTLIEVSELFGLNIDQEMASAIAAGPAFTFEAKVPGKMFDPATRRMNEAAAKFAYGAEIDAALDWARSFAERARIPMSLKPA